MKKIIHAYIFNPSNCIFKSNRNERAKLNTITCENFENCGLYKRNECTYNSAFGWQKCPYGIYSQAIGYTKRARKFSNWIRENEEKYKDVLNKLKGHSGIMTQVGDYVFLPYSHITMNEEVPFLSKGSLLMKENCFLPIKEFNVSNIISILKFRPQAMMGGEITSYQNEILSQFVRHLSEEFPNLYNEVALAYEPIKEINGKYSNIGRKAILQTLTPNVGEFVDIHKGLWIWDGEYLTSKNSKASFMLTNKFSEIRVKPTENIEVEITDEKQINANTKFVS